MTIDSLDEMQEIMASDDTIASVSPRSNNATIFSVPYEAALDSCYNIPHSKLIHCLIKDLLPRYYLAPTAHGFCMLIRRSVIDKFGLFDEVYGRGYGEENDFCLRVSAEGYKHAIANRAYVYHEGSKSFTKKGRDEQVKVNAAILKSRYPLYEQLVAQYMEVCVYPEMSLTENALSQNQIYLSR